MKILSYITLICISSILFIGCGAVTHFKNPNYTYTPNSTKPIGFKPIAPFEIISIDFEHFTDDFDLKGKQGTPKKLAADTLNKFFNAALKKYMDTHPVIDLSNVFNKTVPTKTMSETSPKQNFRFSFAVPKKGSTPELENTYLLSVKNLKFGFVVTTYYNGTTMSTSREFVLEYDYLIYDCATSETVTFGKTKSSQSASFYVDRNDWQQLVYYSLKKILNNAPFNNVGH
ncbi:MAG: hypothetical protein OCC49_15375 [Fibrobacterales bacterium]